MSDSLYAILDACDTPVVPDKACELGESRAVCLYSGRAEEDYWAIAPFLMRVDYDLLSWIIDTLWQTPWGVFAVSNGSLEVVCRHFRRFLRVRSAAGERWYFRYYDPRVLPGFLATCLPDELDALFGPIARYGVTVPEGNEVRWFERSGTRAHAPCRRVGLSFKLREEQLDAFAPANGSSVCVLGPNNAARAEEVLTSVWPPVPRRAQ